MNKFSSERGAGVRRALLAALVAACCGSAAATPTLPQVVAGQASFAQQGNVFSITNTPNTIINWQSFSVNAGEVTRFIQQNANSAVLNRITGQDPSKILGALQSNGQVFLINPNGILFGRDARVDVQGLTASTLDLSNTDFLAGKRNFQAGAGAGTLRNEGRISTGAGGHVFLLASQLDNSGVIDAPDGQVVLAAGKSVTLVDSGNPDLHVVVSAPGDQAVNLGQVISHGGQVGIYGALVRQKGVLNADSAVLGANGKIVLKASGDTLLEAGSRTTATGAGRGGAVSVLGARVAMTGDARIDVSGATGGGTVLLGGDYQGKNAAVPHAQQTTLGKDTLVRADATGRGDGGKLIVWSDGLTRAHGSLSARGGSDGGNGGLIETSGHGLETAGLRIDAGAARGSLGRWLIDPTNVTVVSSPGTPPAGDSEILASTLDGATADVLIQADQTINFAAATTIGSGKSLTATATDINIAADVTTTGSGAITANASGAIVVTGNLATGGGAITLNATGDTTVRVGGAGTLASNGGNIVLQGANVDFASGTINAGNGYLKMSAPGTVGITGAVSAGGLAVSAASVSITPTLAISNVAANVSAGGLTVNSNKALTVGTVGGLSGITASSAVFLDAPGIGGGLITAPEVHLTSSAGVGAAGTPLRTRVGTLYVDNSSATDNIHIDNAIALEIGNAYQYYLGGIYITSHGGLTLPAPDGQNRVETNGGPIVLRTYSPMDIDGVIDSGGGTIMLDAPGGAITIGAGAQVTSGTGPLTLSATSLNNSGSLTTTTGPLSITANSITNTVNGTIGTSGGSLTLTTDSFVNSGSISAYQISALTLTVADCQAQARPTADCTALLDATLKACLVNPTGPDCKLVLPSLSTCVAAPTTLGCAVVLPSMSTCIAAPATPGCSVVLPTLATCIATPTAAGCSVVLPSLSTCVAAPTTPGCSVVLPSLASCIAAPATTGCSVVLPTLSACIAAPATAGCSVVLPSITACIAAPATPGCSVVLPTLSACIAAPTTPGCSVVLPSLAACIAAPGTTGCTVVLPTLAACIAAPATAGCSVVLPSLSQCVATPSLAGCTVVLPSLAQCAASPTLQGCTVVLPSPALCTTTPSAPGCALEPSPPLAGGDGKPASQVTTTTVVLVNAVSADLLPALKTADLLLAPPVPGDGGSGPGAKAADKKAIDSAKPTDNGEAKNVTKKMYCN